MQKAAGLATYPKSPPSQIHARIWKHKKDKYSLDGLNLDTMNSKKYADEMPLMEPTCFPIVEVERDKNTHFFGQYVYNCRRSLTERYSMYDEE